MSGDKDRACNLLMSDLVLQPATEGFCGKLEPLMVGSRPWLDSAISVRSIGAFSGFHIYRVKCGHAQDLQLFTLEAVDICIYTTADRRSLGDGWCELEYC